MLRFKDILGVVDLSQSADTLLERTVDLAQGNQANRTDVQVVARCTPCTACPKDARFSSTLQKAAIAEAAHELDDAVTPLRSQIDIQATVLVGIPFLVNTCEVRRNGHDLVIKTPEAHDCLESVSRQR